MLAPEAARALMRDGRIPEALELLRRDAANPASLVLLREHLVGEGLADKAMPLIERLVSDHGAEAHVSRSIKALLGGDMKLAANEAEMAVRMDARSATAHNHLGRALHNMGESARAISAFERAVQFDQGYAQAWYNLGHVMRATGKLPESIEAYQRALEHSPGYRAARLNLGISYSVQERPGQALECFEALLAGEPEDVEALVNAGLALHQLGRLEEARVHLERALEMHPQHANAWCYLGVLLNEQLDTDAAMEALQRALSINPSDTEARVELAGVLEQTNRLNQARAVVEEGQRLDPGHPALTVEAARLARRDGRSEEAVRMLRKLRPERLPARIAQQAWFELGQALDRCGEWPEAYSAFSAGNRLASQSPRRALVDPDGFDRRCDAIGKWISGGAPGIEPGPGELAGDTGEDLCFLLGFPRSGTTLLDTFLNAHPQVKSVEERPTLESVIEVLRAQDRPYPGGLEALDHAAIEALRTRYRDALEQNAGFRFAPGMLVLDKLPMRTLNVGLIQRLFPASRILFAARHPCDVVLSNFMQSYADNEAFIHFDTLEDSAMIYARVMELWLQYQPHLGIARRVTRYEDLVESPREELQRLCYFLGIGMHENMLDLGQRLAQRGRIRTNSYQQVAEPVYARAKGRWENYAAHFEGLIPSLRLYLDHFGYAGQGNGDNGHG